MRKYFTPVDSIGSKNISNIYAGGDHSWIVINDEHTLRMQPKIVARSNVSKQIYDIEPIVS